MRTVPESSECHLEVGNLSFVELESFLNPARKLGQKYPRYERLFCPEVHGAIEPAQQSFTLRINSIWMIRRRISSLSAFKAGIQSNSVIRHSISVTAGSASRLTHPGKRVQKC